MLRAKVNRLLLKTLDKTGKVIQIDVKQAVYFIRRAWRSVLVGVGFCVSQGLTYGGLFVVYLIIQVIEFPSEYSFFDKMFYSFSLMSWHTFLIRSHEQYIRLILYFLSVNVGLWYILMKPVSFWKHKKLRILIRYSLLFL